MIVEERLENHAVGVQAFEVVVFQGGQIAFALVLGRLALVDRALQVVLLVQRDIGRNQVVHDHETNVLVRTLIAVQAEELRQQGKRVLGQVHVIAGQQAEQEASFFLGYCFDDVGIIGGDVEDRTTGTWIG